MAKTNIKDDDTLLRQKPSLKLLRNIVVPRVSANWKPIGLNLDIKDYRLSAIEKSKLFQTDDCCTEMFSIWLSLAPHTGGLPLTWGSVLSAIGKVERVTSEELLTELKSNTEALLQDPTHQVTHKLAAELKRYYGRLQPVVRDGYNPKLDYVELAVVERQEYGLKKKKNLEEFLHATVNGIDDIYQKSSRVEYRDILTLENGSTTDTGKRIIISGAPGSGKTTLVRQLCKDLSSGSLPNDYTLVVLVVLRELILLLKDQEEAQLHHFLMKFKRKFEINEVCQELEESDGKGTLLVLDGFDELDAKLRSCQLLRDLLSVESNYLPECDILVTSRPVTCPDLLELMTPLHRHIEILGFSEDCIASFVRSYFKRPSQPPLPPTFKSLPTQQPPSQPPLSQSAPSQTSVEGREAEKLLHRLDQLPQVKGMCRIPVVLNIVCKVCQLLGADSLPATMTGIYEIFIIRQLLANDPKASGTEISSILHVPTSEYPFFNKLCKIAFECCTNQKLIISKEDIGETLPPFERGSIYGLLVTDPVEDLFAVQELVLYHFMHKTVQEALAARNVAMLPNSKSHLKLWKRYFGRPEMAEVWKFYCGLTQLQHVSISSILQLVDEVDQDMHTLLVVSLFEAGNISLARRELPRIFPAEMNIIPATPYETAAYAFALQHHISLKSLYISWMDDVLETVNLQLLLDALSCHPTARELYIRNNIAEVAANDMQAVCQFLSGKHRLTRIYLLAMPIMVVEIILSTESSTMKELEWIYATPPEPEEYDLLSLADSIKSSSLRSIIIQGPLDEMLLPILRGFAANTKTVHRTVKCPDTVIFNTPLVSKLPELRRFLVPCINCHLLMSLPIGLWGTLLSGVGAARQLERLTVKMFGKPDEAGPEWDHIDQTTLEEVERSWALSKCSEVEFDISSENDTYAGCTLSHSGMKGNTLAETIKLLSAAVSGIVQRKDLFVLELHVNDAQVSTLARIKRIAKKRCAVKVTEIESQSRPEGEIQEKITVLKAEAI